MNPIFPVKEEGQGSSSRWSQEMQPLTFPPQPMEGLHDVGPPPFLTKTYEMVDDPNIDHIISWSRGGMSFVVWDPNSFSTIMLPRHFKHNNFSSFVRQLNTYGFRKIDSDKWEFANEEFMRGQKHILKNIKRRKASCQPVHPQQTTGPCVEVGRFGVDGEVDRLRRDKQVLMMELVKVRQQQQNTKAYVQAMEERLQRAETKQQQTMAFLARAMQNPDFVLHLAQLKDKRKELEEAISKKRRRPIDQEPICIGEGEPSLSAEGRGKNPIKDEPPECRDYGLEVSELEELALEMQGLSKGTSEPEAAHREFEASPNEDKELDVGFWEDLLSERFEGELQMTGARGEEDEKDIVFLADRLGYLGSSLK